MKVQSSVESWVHYDVSSTFILLIVADLKLREQEARVKVCDLYLTLTVVSIVML